MSRPNSRRRGAPCYAHDECECGREICDDCPDVPESCCKEQAA